ncbi:MAG TPA: PilZ domain-containing protein [Gaiellales bacterium]|nr:PilZ domain-containing protein [Gaiellales bacterium]
MDAERREFFRVMVRLPVRCLAVAADGSASLMMVRSVDLSAGGVCVVTDRVLGSGDQVRLAFQVPDGTLFKLEGHVAHTDVLPDGMRRYGLEFAELTPATEQRMFKAVFEQEQVNAGRHAHVRMSVWEPVTCRADGELQAFPAHALQLSADDLQVITRRELHIGERLHVAMADAGLGFSIDAAAEVVDAQQDPRGSHVATLAFDGLDRITRSSILRRAMEQERRERAGE